MFNRSWGVWSEGGVKVWRSGAHGSHAGRGYGRAVSPSPRPATRARKWCERPGSPGRGPPRAAGPYPGDDVLGGVGVVDEPEPDRPGARRTRRGGGLDDDHVGVVADVQAVRDTHRDVLLQPGGLTRVVDTGHLRTAAAAVPAEHDPAGRGPGTRGLGRRLGREDGHTRLRIRARTRSRPADDLPALGRGGAGRSSDSGSSRRGAFPVSQWRACPARPPHRCASVPDSHRIPWPRKGARPAPRGYQVSTRSQSFSGPARAPPRPRDPGHNLEEGKVTAMPPAAPLTI